MNNQKMKRGSSYDYKTRHTGLRFGLERRSAFCKQKPEDDPGKTKKRPTSKTPETKNVNKKRCVQSIKKKTEPQHNNEESFDSTEVAQESNEEDN